MLSLSYITKNFKYHFIRDTEGVLPLSMQSSGGQSRQEKVILGFTRGRLLLFQGNRGTEHYAKVSCY